MFIEDILVIISACLLSMNYLLTANQSAGLRGLYLH